jgi:hypothetical protein
MAMGEGQSAETKPVKVPAWQIFYDDISLIFMLGMVIPVVMYIIWGLMEIISVPAEPPQP